LKATDDPEAIKLMIAKAGFKHNELCKERFLLTDRSMPTKNQKGLSNEQE
jgi:hypothetical protein